MKLYYSPGACCMSCHIALEIAKLPFDLVYVGKNAPEETRKAFLKVNPLGMVPALKLDNQQILTQNIAILEYVADQKPESKLLAQAGTLERAQTMMWLSFIAADLHKAFAPLFALNKISTHADAQADVKAWATSLIDKYLTYVDTHLQNNQYLVGNQFTIADCYLYTVYRWTKAINHPTEHYTALNRYSAAIDKMPAVIAVHEREKLSHTHV